MPYRYELPLFRAVLSRVEITAPIRETLSHSDHQNRDRTELPTDKDLASLTSRGVPHTALVARWSEAGLELGSGLRSGTIGTNYSHGANH
ncbi:hypothetical protein RRG08_060055 [Elysia crispata]|uniref:Uncharacterized protein n=1 Tax=Elysia crispata TaxID=231223 RepID=A0AAE1CQH5_9GAST|nr:hypothetical protein RRG08_060055 [Elysia crispata]